MMTKQKNIPQLIVPNLSLRLQKILKLQKYLGRLQLLQSFLLQGKRDHIQPNSYKKPLFLLFLISYKMKSEIPSLLKLPLNQRVKLLQKMQIPLELSPNQHQLLLRKQQRNVLLEEEGLECPFLLLPLLQLNLNLLVQLVDVKISFLIHSRKNIAINAFTSIHNIHKNISSQHTSSCRDK
jgi:hypothetical protein